VCDRTGGICEKDRLLTLAGGSVATAAVLNITPSGTTTTPGSSVSVNVGITGATDLYAYQFDLAFTPAVLSLTSIAEGALLAAGGATFFVPGVIDNTAGTATGTANTLVGLVAGVSGSGTIATLLFMAGAAGVGTISIANPILLDSNLADITVQVTGGSITVQQTDGAVPEPATVMLVGSALAGVLAIRLRRRRANWAN
jgi:general secretion pathway protein D